MLAVGAWETQPLSASLPGPGEKVPDPEVALLCSIKDGLKGALQCAIDLVGFPLYGSTNPSFISEDTNSLFMTLNRDKKVTCQ